MAIQTNINQAGPFPILMPFHAPSEAPLVLVVSGSVWGAAAHAAIGINIARDGQSSGFAQILSHGPTTHRAVVPTSLPAQLTQGPHTLSWTAFPGATQSEVTNCYTTVMND